MKNEIRIAFKKVLLKMQGSLTEKEKLCTCHLLSKYLFCWWNKLACLKRPNCPSHCCTFLEMSVSVSCWQYAFLNNDTQYNDTQYNDTQYNHTQYNHTQYNDTQYNDTQYNDTQYNDTQYNDTQHNNTQYNRHYCDTQQKRHLERQNKKQCTNDPQNNNIDSSFLCWNYSHSKSLSCSFRLSIASSIKYYHQTIISLEFFKLPMPSF